jgi:hypothetical protein
MDQGGNQVHGCLCVSLKAHKLCSQIRTWTNDTALGCLSLGQARMQGLDRIYTPRKSHDDWREWIYLSLMDKL